MSHKAVKFHPDVSVWLHNVTLGDNPTCARGPPVMLDYTWNNPIIRWNPPPKTTAAGTTDPSMGDNDLPPSTQDRIILPLQQIQEAADRRYYTAAMERQRRRLKHLPVAQGPPVRRLSPLERQDAVLQCQAACEEDVHSIMVAWQRQVQREMRRIQQSRLWSIRTTIVLRSLERVRRVWHKIRTGTRRRRRRIVQEWYACYSKQES
eukprot:scaffold1749_cov181-Amphora_coffeaeformis.AAC.2